MIEVISNILVLLFDEGVFVDLWTVPHILFGVLMFLLVQRYKKDIWFGFFLTLVLAVVWEFMEIYFQVFEHQPNQIVDVLMALVGYLTMIVGRTKIYNNKYFIQVTIFFYILFNFLGWLSYYIRVEV